MVMSAASCTIRVDPLLDCFVTLDKHLDTWLSIPFPQTCSSKSERPAPACEMNIKPRFMLELKFNEAREFISERIVSRFDC